MTIGEALGEILAELRTLPWWRAVRRRELMAAIAVLSPMFEGSVEAAVIEAETAAARVGDPELLARARRLRAIMAERRGVAPRQKSDTVEGR